jgi:hypothetical protein
MKWWGESLSARYNRRKWRFHHRGYPDHQRRAQEEQKVKEENYWLRERRYGSFSRSITLPLEVIADKAELPSITES